MSSAHAGSLGGLIALRRGEAHLAGSHLLDPETGEYNFSYIKQYLPNLPVVVVTLLRREQGLIVARGNPKNIASLKDLARSDVRFVNRQRGAGTRVLLDYQLKLAGVSADLIKGYNQEEYTHLGVAAAVASGRADCGLAIAAAAQALDLEFNPLFQERYDLVVLQTVLDSGRMQTVLDAVHSATFRRRGAELQGYDLTHSGRVVARIK